VQKLTYILFNTAVYIARELAIILMKAAEGGEGLRSLRGKGEDSYGCGAGDE
jgi:hypothetical protein